MVLTLTEVIIKALLLTAFFVGVYVVALLRDKRGKHLGWLLSALLAIAFGFISMHYGAVVDLDRGRYALHYEDNMDLSANSWGMNWFFQLCHGFGFSADNMFQMFSTIYFFAILASYNLAKNRTPLGLLLLLMSYYVVYGFSIIKQGFSQSAVMVALILFFNMAYQERRGRLLTLLFVVVFTWIGLLFHEAAYIMLPIFLLLLLWDNRIVRYVGYGLLVVGLVAFGWVRDQYASVIGSYSEFLAEQSAAYIAGPAVVTNILTAFKGAPFFIISAVGIANRRRFADEIKGYDRYLFLALLCSVFYIVSSVVVWYARFSYYLFFPVLLFSAELYRVMRDEGRTNWWLVAAFALSIILQLRSIVTYLLLYGGF